MQSRISIIKRLFNNFTSFFTIKEEEPTYCCQECPSIEQYNWMDENIYSTLIAEGKLSQEMIEKHNISIWLIVE